ncbi:DUF4189 domain-containing protein [Lysobacter alkalisoli]|uniref:DUF4189 domain-containing protein n=2 Tax=Marilutibacter alkalisoli TaxID=2591633 RepID=A0A514BP51_9GAMM|nr:DUF4189 domain-containing protein [Lysobacter alkalisoli]
MKHSMIAIPVAFMAVIAGVAILFQPQPAQAQRPVVVIPMCTSPVARNQMHVERTFGALAYDDRTATWYTTYGYPSKGKARKGVISHCQDKGGSCRLMLSYSNQCAAVARVIENGAPVPGKDSLNTGSTEAEAGANALRSCEADWGSACATQFVNCSHSGVNVTRWTEWQQHQC